jgi:hypothetical protein
MRHAILVVFSLLSGCAALAFSEAECKGMNWRQRGEADGKGGHPTQVVRFQQQCGRHGIEVNDTEYLAGWAEGHDEWDRLMGSMRKMSR